MAPWAISSSVETRTGEEARGWGAMAAAWEAAPRRTKVAESFIVTERIDERGMGNG